MPFEKKETTFGSGSGSEEKKKDEKPTGKRARRRQRRKENRKMVQETTKKQQSVQGDLLALVEKKKAEIAQAEKESKLKENKVKTGISLLYPQHPHLHQIEYISEPSLSESNPHYDEFKAIFQKFATPQELTAPRKRISEDITDIEERELNKTLEKEKKGEILPEEDKTLSDKKLSRRERKLKNRLSVAALKQQCDRPDLVEIHDANSIDPRMLVILKSYRNTVAVPPHWLQKRKYLQNKRGIEKQAFELPDFIAATGITKIRAAQQEKEEHMKLKQKMRQKMQPKMGRMDIDYQTLHDAFFRYQTKPKMTRHGDLYYEGKEFEVKLKSKLPGELSEEMMRALGMTNGKLSPPPWLFNMQRYGPPPSYPNLKIPGVNAPIPEGTRYGYGEGEWGTPPTDEYGRPLYGDVFGTERKIEDEDDVATEPFDKTLWGQMVEEEEQEEEEEEASSEEEVEETEEKEEEPEEVDKSGMESTTSVASGLDTPEQLQLRKQKDGTGTETPETVERPKALYTVLEEKQTTVPTNAMFGSAHTYVVPAPTTAPLTMLKDNQNKRKEAKKPGEVAVAFTPEELENLDAGTLKRKYDAQVEAEKAATRVDRSDINEVIEEQSRKKRRKETKDKKKYKF